jgi:predicted DCC family thiol-disulfide oxidoreductase YuxK
MHSKITFPLTIYYDASCPLCRTEMETLKQADAANQLILVDCSQMAMQLPDSCPVTRDALMNRIHAQDATGRWITAVEVFAAAYTATGFTKMGKFWSSRILRPILSRAYPWVADHRQWLSKTPLPWLLHKLLSKNTQRR